MIRAVDRITHLLTAIADAKESIAGLTKEQFLGSKDKRVAAERYILIREMKILIGSLACHEEEVYAAWNNAVQGMPFE